MAYRYKEDCFVERENSIHPDKVWVFDNEGNELFRVPASFTNDDIWKVLDLMNYAYDLGLSVGRRLKADEIKSVLEIK